MQTEPSKADPPNRNRRWLQFSLRALMILATATAVACGYLAHESKFVVDKRNDWLKQHRQWFLTDDYRAVAGGDPSRSPSQLRLWIGDEASAVIAIDGDPSEAELRAAVDLFPEADVYVQRSCRIPPISTARRPTETKAPSGAY